MLSPTSLATRLPDVVIAPFRGIANLARRVIDAVKAFFVSCWQNFRSWCIDKPKVSVVTSAPQPLPYPSAPPVLSDAQSSNSAPNTARGDFDIVTPRPAGGLSRSTSNESNTESVDSDGDKQRSETQPLSALPFYGRWFGLRKPATRRDPE